jgi:hypothetical protein
MTRKHVFLVVILVAFIGTASIATAQTITNGNDLKKAVTFIFRADAQGDLLRDPKTKSPTPYGTGFFVGVKNDTGKGLYGYLVTAKHVLKDQKGTDFAKVYLRLDTWNGDAEFVPLDLIQNSQRVVYMHSDPTVDIAVVPFLPNPTVFDFKILPDEILSTEETFRKYNIAEGSDVFFVGLFATFYGEHQNVPIFRFGRMAMFPDEPVPWINYQGQSPQQAQLYLIEIQSYGGNSGSPVFFSLGVTEQRVPPGNILLGGSASPLLKLAGIMRGRFNDVEPLTLIQSPTAAVLVTTPNIGIAAVTPSYFLHDILFSDALKKWRAEHPIVELPEKSDHTRQ